VLIGCQPKIDAKIQTDESINKIDSIIIHSEQTFAASSAASSKSDSTINQKVENVVKQITVLKEENKQLKSENNELKIILDSVDDVGKPFKLLPVSGNKDNR
jgi:hypothetical protein